MNLYRVSNLVGTLLIGLAAAMATSLPWALFYDETRTQIAFGTSIAITLSSGIMAWYIGRRAQGTIFRREAMAVVGIFWLLLGFYGGLPYMLDGALPHVADAYFETVSGFTTTGSTVLTEIESLSEALHWWRTMTHWLGGMGIIVLFVAVLPQLGVGGKLLFKTEVPGPITEGLRPKIRETSITLWWIYVGFTVVETILLKIFGPTAEEVAAKGLSPNAVMDWHNAITHSFATMATGGFSTLNNSVAGFDSVSVDVIITIFMFFAGINFSLYYAVIRGGWRRAIRDRELWMYSGTIFLVTLIITFLIWGSSLPDDPNWAIRHESVWNSLRYAVFQVLGVITSTGFGSDDFNQYHPLGKLLLIGLMFMGGMAGSTAGGMKVFRFLVMFKAIWQQVLQAFRPARVQIMRVSGRTISNETVQGILAFLALGCISWAAASLYMAFLGLDVVTATTSVTATLFNIGPGLERVGPVENFSFIPASGKFVLSLCMVLGRLEFYSILVLLVPEFWRE